MKRSFVPGLNSLPLPGHKQFIWAEKPTGPLGVLQLLAGGKRPVGGLAQTPGTGFLTRFHPLQGENQFKQ